MKIGVFGGSFNPPHFMHLNIAKSLIENHYVEKVIFVPTGMKYEYKNNLLPNENRYKMLQLLIKNEKNMDISTNEFQDQVVYTYQTLDYLKEKYPNDEVLFICGTDNLSYLDKWKEAEYLMSHNKFIIIKRDTNPIEPLLEKFKEYKDHFIETDIIPDGMSSTWIREQIKEGKIDSLKEVVPEEIVNYIKENNLYQES